MPSDKIYHKVSGSNAGVYLDLFLIKFCKQYKVAAFITAEVEPIDETITAVDSWPVGLEIFKGAEKGHVEVLYSECSKNFKSHCHATSNIAIGNILKKHQKDLNGLNRCWFIPIETCCGKYAFFAFPACSDKESKTIPQQFIDGIGDLLDLKFRSTGFERLNKKLEVLDKYVKEVGHDIASSVQATVAKLAAISEGHIDDEYINDKALEAEKEIMAVYRVAEGLGVTMDSNYQMKEFSSVDFPEVIEEAVYLHESEAAENSITINTTIQKFVVSDTMLVGGDHKALVQMLGHLLSNAIKYGFKHTRIEILASCSYEFLTLQVRNLGLPLPEGSEKNKIWEFGERGEVAKSKHVNGSGIGLFTVRKIILAHHGVVSANHDKTSKQTTLTVTLPLYENLKRIKPDLIFRDFRTVGGTYYR